MNSRKFLNSEDSKFHIKQILKVYKNETEELIRVYGSGEIITVSPSPPFYVNQFGWTRAVQLRAGDVLVLSNGEYVVVWYVKNKTLLSF